MFDFPPKAVEPKWKLSIKYNINEQQEKQKLRDKKQIEEKNPKAAVTTDKEKDA
jgi:hypothetical protein